MKPFFTIIIPCYNSAAFIHTALESLIGQTFPDFEVLIVDAASSDNTVEIVLAYEDSRFRVFSEKDKGIYDAMNKGIKLAKGEWLFFLGSDDRLFDEKVLHDTAVVICKQKSDVVYGNVLVAGDTRWAKNNEVYGGRFTLDKLLRKNICHQSIFYRKEFLIQKGLEFNLRFPVNADWDINIKSWLLTRWFYFERTIAIFDTGGVSSEKVNNDPFKYEMKEMYKKYYPSEFRMSVSRLKKKILGWF